MPTLAQVHASNALLATTSPSLTAIFIGGTSGIGEATAKALAKRIPKPTIYIVGRNETAGSRILQELRAIQPDGEYTFISADLTLLKNVDAVATDLKATLKNKPVDILFLSTGGLSMTRNDTTEHLESNHVLRYYARSLLTISLLPNLSLSRSPRVINILAAGKEIPYPKLDMTNLDLHRPNSFSLTTAGYYATTMLSLSQEYLSTKNPGVSFAHVFPGFVATPVFTRGFGNILGGAIDALVRLFGVGIEECGERCLFVATSGAYPPLKSKQGVDTATCTASTGVVGGGCYVLGYDGRDVSDKGLFGGYRERGVPERVWGHTIGVFERVLGRGFE
ncbi:NAD(P)-binding protein [Aspergillus karnatakaensis]|uniref:NAD(P)-binding protein n=1 Tax=Aspergillus karnatakaensis TaxID=1810916 RepID=UPI003CCCCBF9